MEFSSALVVLFDADGADGAGEGIADSFALDGGDEGAAHATSPEAMSRVVVTLATLAVCRRR